MVKIYRILFIWILILIGLFVINFVLGFLSMGDDVNTKQVEINRLVNSIVGFPMELVKDGFPLLLSNNELWTWPNVVLLLLNTLLQATGISFIAHYIKKRIEKK